MERFLREWPYCNFEFARDQERTRPNKRQTNANKDSEAMKYRKKNK